VPPARTLPQQVAAGAAVAGIKVPQHVCPSCAGRGFVPIAAHLLATWHALDETKGRTVVEVAALCRESKEATTHRLGMLAGLGLARILRKRLIIGRRAAAEWIRVQTTESWA
jgi:hypothetical protein